TGRERKEVSTEAKLSHAPICVRLATCQLLAQVPCLETASSISDLAKLQRLTDSDKDKVIAGKGYAKVGPLGKLALDGRWKVAETLQRIGWTCTKSGEPEDDVRANYEKEALARADTRLIAELFKGYDPKMTTFQQE
ncbi:3-oxoacyl-[acyl-carrier-protein] synthase, partial [Tulasnella sp. 427]